MSSGPIIVGKFNSASGISIERVCSIDERRLFSESEEVIVIRLSPSNRFTEGIIEKYPLLSVFDVPTTVSL